MFITMYGPLTIAEELEIHQRRTKMSLNYIVHIEI